MDDARSPDFDPRAVSELECSARIRVDQLIEIVIAEAEKLSRARDVTDKQKEAVTVAKTMINIRAAEMLEHISTVEMSYQRLRLLASVQDMIVHVFLIASKGEGNRAIEKALAKGRNQTAKGRSVASSTKKKRRDLLRPHVLGVLASNPDCDAKAVINHLSRLPKADRPAELWEVERTQRKADVQAIIDEARTAPKAV